MPWFDAALLWKEDGEGSGWVFSADWFSFNNRFSSKKAIKNKKKPSGQVWQE